MQQNMMSYKISGIFSGERLFIAYHSIFRSVLWCRWLGSRKGIWPV